MGIALLCTLAGLHLAPSVPLPVPRPRLLVLITVDQMRADYLERYRPQFHGGLGMLLREGAVFTEAFQDHAVTETAPGHATILSGRTPAHTGIIRNLAGVQDSSAPLVGVTGPGASPARFRGTTLFDWLKAAEPGSRALSVSRKDRGAILPVGRAKENVYWYQAGRFTTSRYYTDSLPVWVRAFNAQRLPFNEAGAVWNTLLSPAEYSEPDSEAYEHAGHDFTFPHHLPADPAEAADSLVEVPTMDSLTLAFALAGVRALGLGGRGSTDLLAVSLSTTDAIGHLYGPDSREIHDQVVRLDRYLGWFFGQLMVRYGGSGVTIVLTSDHGMTPYPEWSRAHGHPDARRVSVDTIVSAVNAELEARGGGHGALSFDTGLLLLQPAERAHLGAAGVNVDSVVAALAGRLRTAAGVARVQTVADLAAADTATDPVARRWRHQIPPDAGVELTITLKPYCIWDAAVPIAMHGQPTELDAHVPLLFWGRGIRHEVSGARVRTVDIAPTLARLLDLTPAEPVDGRVLTDALTAGT